jgi:hypothetical protein
MTTRRSVAETVDLAHDQGFIEVSLRRRSLGDGMTLRRVTFAVSLAVCFLNVSAGAAAQPRSIDGPPAPIAPAVMSRDANGKTTIRSIRLVEPLDVDGALDEAIYQTVPPITAFIQMLPQPGRPGTERTEAWVMFDGDNIYVGARCWDSAMTGLANELRRDASQIRENDHFAVSFDTFYDRRNGFAFSANPVGGRGDFTTTDEGNPNTDWNPVWDARTARFAGGWTVEMVIPFKSLRYRSGADQVWGIQFRRLIRRKNEWLYLTAIPASGVGAFAGAALNRLSMAATLVGLDLPSASRNVELKPYAISRLTTNRLARPPISNDATGDVGFDAKYGITANLTADFSYNTDFAQVEIDEQQVNLTRFNLFFPEKRDFFLEGRGFFDFGRPAGLLGTSTVTGLTPLLFYSRRIGLTRNQVVPIDVGGRLTGKIGKTGIGVLNIQTGEEGESIPATNFTVARVKRDVFRRSTIGAMFTNRSNSLAGDGDSQAYGVDGALLLLQDLNVSGYLARTETPESPDDTTSYQTRVDYAGDSYGAQVDRLVVGDHFNPEVGFFNRRGFERSFGSLRYSPRPRSMKSVRRFTWEGSFEYIENRAGALESREERGRFNTEFQRGDQFEIAVGRNFDHPVEPFTVQGLTITPGDYTYSDVQVSYTFGPQRRYSGRLFTQQGHYYGGTISSVGLATTRVSVTPQLSIEPSVSINRIDVPVGRSTSKLIRTRADYAFSPRMFTSALLQYSSSDRSFSNNLRFRWEFHPGSELFVVYTDERDTEQSAVASLRNRAFVVKVNRLFRF